MSKKILFSVPLLALFFFLPSQAHAVGYSFTDTSEFANNLHWSFANWGVTLATSSVSGSLNAVSFYAEGDAANAWVLGVIDLTDNVCVTTAFEGCYVRLLAGSHPSTGPLTFDLTELQPGLELDATHQYQFVMANAGGGAFNDFDLYGGPNPGGLVPTSGGGSPWAAFTGDGNVPYIVVDAGVAPAGNGSTATQVIRINAPRDFATTTEPFTVDFDAYVNSFASTTDGYELVFTHDNTGVSRSVVGLLPAHDLDTPFNVSTTTSPGLPLEGAYTLQIVLGGGAAEHIANPSLPFYTNGWYTASHFGIGIYDSQWNYDVPPYVGSGYASSSCSINFLGSDFNLGDCIGYIVAPTASSTQNFANITLANRVPFSYAYDIGLLRSELFGAPENGTTTISATVPGFGTITFLSAAMIAAVPFAPTIKLILAALIWLLGAEVIYYTVLRSHNTNTGV